MKMIRYPFFGTRHAALKETHKNIKLTVFLKNYLANNWNICGDQKSCRLSYWHAGTPNINAFCVFGTVFKTISNIIQKCFVSEKFKIHHISLVDQKK